MHGDEYNPRTPDPSESSHVESSGQDLSTPSSPPIVQGEVAGVVGPVVWPVVLGTVCVIFGALGLIQGIWTLVSPWFLRWFESLIGPQASPTFRPILSWTWWMYLSGVLVSILAGLLLYGGISLMKRRRKAVPLLRIWAVGKITLAVVSVVPGYMMQEANMAMASSSSGVFMSLMVYGGLALGVIWMLVLPVLILVMLNMKFTRVEVARWSH